MAAPTDAPTFQLTDTIIDSPTAGQWSGANPAPNPVITTTSNTFNIASVTSIPIHTSTYIMQQIGTTYWTNQVIEVTDGTHVTHYQITATTGGPPATGLTVTPIVLSGDSTTGTMASGANVEITSGLLINGFFDVGGGNSGPGSSELIGAPWATVNGPYSLAGGNSPDYGPDSSSTSEQTISGHVWSLLLDNPADAVGQTFYAPLNIVPAWPDPSGLTNPRCWEFLYTAQIRAQVSGSLAALAVVITAYDSGGDVLGVQGPIVLNPSSTTGWSSVRAAFSFATLTVVPDHYQIINASGPNNSSGNGIWVAGSALTPISNGPILSNAGNSQVRWTANYNTINQTYMVRTYSGGENFSQVGILGMLMSTQIPVADLYLRFGFVETGGSTITWSNTILFNSPTNNFAYCDISTVLASIPLTSVEYLYIEATADLPLTDLPPGSNTNILTFGPLSNGGNLDIGGFTYQYYVSEGIVIDQTATTDTGATTGSTATHVTSTALSGAAPDQQVYITGGSGWTPGAYYIVSISGTTAVLNAAPSGASASGGHITVLSTRNDIVQSNPSLSSALATPTYAQAQVEVTAPADCPVNTAGSNPPGQYLIYYLWRLGGQWTYPFLVAVVDSRYNVALGSDPNNPYYSFTAATLTWIDNTPDTQFSAVTTPISFSRDPMPANCTCNAEYNGRLFQAIGNLVYVSWLYNSDTSAPLYTTLEQNLDDSNAPIAGAWFPCAGNVTDTVVRLIPFGTPAGIGQGTEGGSNQFGGGLLVLNKRSIGVIQGTNSGPGPGSWSYTQYPYTENVGLVAFRGVEKLDTNEVVWFGPNRLHVFPPRNDTAQKDIGLAIQPDLYPQAPWQSTFQTPSAFALSWLKFHDHYLFAGVPVPGAAAPNVVWVYDLWSSGWTQLTTMQGAGSNNMFFTGARSLPPNVSTGAAYQLMLMGASSLNGQLYLMEGTEDLTAPGAATNPIPWTIEFHGLRPGFFYRYKLHALYYRRGRAEYIEVECVKNGALTITAQAYQPGPGAFTPITGKSFSKVYNLTGGGNGFRVHLPAGVVEGEYVGVTLSGSETAQCYIRGVRTWMSNTTEDVV